jgi:hypothetical protein
LHNDELVAISKENHSTQSKTKYDIYVKALKCEMHDFVLQHTPWVFLHVMENKMTTAQNNDDKMFIMDYSRRAESSSPVQNEKEFLVWPYMIS